MNANAQLKAYIDRILRCREAEDLAKEDTKAVYAELAAEGYEKAVVGQVVTFLRKREKDGDKLSEQSAKFDLYLEAYERPSHAHTRVRDDDVKPRLIKQVVDGMQTDAGRAALIAAVDIMIGREEAEETHERPSTNDEPSPEAGPQAEASPAGTGAGMLADREGRSNGEAVPADLPTHSEKATVATQGEATAFPSVERVSPSDGGSADANTGGSHVTGSSIPAAMTAEGHASAPSANRSALRPHCLNPGEACGGWGSNHCHTCKLAIKERELA